ncbi:MAG TPA: tetratricopeptide repeat protein [Thermoanaerobaculia bacterium]|nr:tetratricopeptide repeat protein [Thermoanaerobaculia bacterium]
MNERLTRKEMKRDEFAMAMGRGVEYAGSHVRPILIAVGGVLLLLLAGLGLWTYFRSQAAKASAQLAPAMEVYQAPIQATGAKPDDPTTPSFPNEAARRERAKKLFEELRDDYGSTDAADVAGVYLADIAAEEGQLDRARELWTDFLDEHDDHILAGAVQLNLFELDRKQGKGEEVVTRLRGIVDQADGPLPQDVALHELGVTLEHLGRPQEAVPQYQKILDEYPQSAYRQEAQQRLGALDPTRAGGGIMPGGPSMPGGFPG